MRSSLAYKDRLQESPFRAFLLSLPSCFSPTLPFLHLFAVLHAIYRPADTPFAFPTSLRYIPSMEAALIQVRRMKREIRDPAIKQDLGDQLQLQRRHQGSGDQGIQKITETLIKDLLSISQAVFLIHILTRFKEKRSDHESITTTAPLCASAPSPFLLDSTSGA